MKNLKQVLALGMAFSLSMSAMAGAAFSDSADIKATEAVDMLNALGIITGYEDGSFKPEKTVSRAEAAKMIFSIRNNGSINADSFKTAPTTFTDISGHWAEGYIKYCQTMGIISGKSATIFDPNGTVKGTELAKMMLVTLGYDAQKAGIYGATWATTTLALASENGLLDGVDSDLTAGLPRQYTAQMMYNAIQAPTVRWSTDGNAYTDMGTNNMPNETVGSKYMNLTIYEGTLEGSGDFNAGNDKVKIEVEKIDGVEVAKENKGDKTFTFATDLTGMYGQYVKVLSNDKNNAYGVYAVSGKNTVATSALSDVKTTDNNNKVKVGDAEYRIASTDVYDLSNDAKLVEGVSANNSNPAGNILRSTSYNSADQITFVSNDGDEKFDIAFVNPMQGFGKVSYVGSDKVIAAGKNYDVDNTIIPEDIAKDDYVAVYTDVFTGKNKLVKAEKVSGKITATKGTKTNDNVEVKVNDTWYKVAANDAKFTDMVYIPKADIDVLAVKNTVDMYLIDGIVYGATKTQGGSTDTAIVLVNTGNLDANGNYQVKMLFADGTTKVVGADKYYDGENGTDNINDNSLVTYTVDSDGAYKLDLVDSSNTAGGKTAVTGVYGFDEDADRIKVDAAGTQVYRIADDATVYITDEDGSKVITGKQLKAFSENYITADQNTGVVVLNDDGIATIVYLPNTGSESPISSGTELYGVITSEVAIGEDDSEFTVWTSNGESMDVKAKGTSLGISKGDVIRFETSENGYITKVKTNDSGITVHEAAIKDATSSYITFHDKVNKKKDFDFDSAKFIYMNTTDGVYEGLAAGDLAEAKPTTGNDAQKGDYYENAKVVLNNKGDKVVFVAVDVTGEWDGLGVQSDAD